MEKSGPLYGPFSGDVKPAPGPKENAHSFDAASSLAATPAKLDTPFTEGNFEYHKGDAAVGMTLVHPLPHGDAKIDSPFHGDVRPGVDSSKK